MSSSDLTFKSWHFSWDKNPHPKDSICLPTSWPVRMAVKWPDGHISRGIYRFAKIPHPGDPRFDGGWGENLALLRSTIHGCLTWIIIPRSAKVAFILDPKPLKEIKYPKKWSPWMIR